MNQAGGRRLRVSDGIVTTCALQARGFAVDYISIDRRRDRFMTAAAGVLGDLVIELRDFDGVGIVTAGEVERVPESVIGLYGVLPDDVVGSMAVVAGGDGMMTGFHPGVILRLHYVAVGAGRGTICEVGISFGVNKGIGAQTNRDAKEQSGRNSGDDCTLHELSGDEDTP